MPLSHASHYMNRKDLHEHAMHKSSTDLLKRLLTRTVLTRIAFIGSLLLAQFTLAACIGTPKLEPGEKLSDDLIDAYNNAATAAMSKPKPRAPSGSRSPQSIARAAVLKHDRQHVHLFNQDVRQLNYRYYHSYITADEWYQQYLKLFVDRGVIPNLTYRSNKDLYILKLKGDHSLNERSVAILKRMHNRWWSTMNLVVPRIQIANNNTRSRGANYHFHGVTVIDPPAIRHFAKRFLIDEHDAIDAVALHEAAHAVHGRMFGQGKSAAFKGKLKAIADAAKGRTNFRSAGEVVEFLADAVGIQHSASAVQLVATRLVRPGKRLGTLTDRKNSKDPVLRVRHDASALFMLALLEQEQLRNKPRDKKLLVQRIRRDGRTSANKQKAPTPNLYWVQSRWVPFVKTTLTASAVQRIQREYEKVFTSILSILTEPDT